MTNLKILLEADGGGTLQQKRHKTVVNICRAGTDGQLLAKTRTAPPLGLLGQETSREQTCHE